MNKEHLDDLISMRNECHKETRAWRIAFYVSFSVMFIMVVLNILLVNLI